jgi:hypothetical protein
LARAADRSALRTKRSNFDEVPESMRLRKIAHGFRVGDLQINKRTFSNGQIALLEHAQINVAVAQRLIVGPRVTNP